MAMVVIIFAALNVASVSHVKIVAVIKQQSNSLKKDKKLLLVVKAYTLCAQSVANVLVVVVLVKIIRRWYHEDRARGVS